MGREVTWVRLWVCDDMNNDIYILYSHTGSLFSKFIKLFTKSKYNHVSLCLNGDFVDFYSFGRRVVLFPLLSGFVIEALDKGTFKYFNNTICSLYKIKVDNEKHVKLENIVNRFIDNKYEYRFNLIGMIGFVFNVPIRRKNKFCCSQFVASVINESGIYGFTKSTFLVSPNDIFEIPNALCIYEGKIDGLRDFVRLKM